MSKIEIGLGSLHINASVIAQGLALEPSRVQAMMRKGEITSLCERGVNEDAGRYRLTFFHKSRRFRLVVDGTGTRERAIRHGKPVRAGGNIGIGHRGFLHSRHYADV